MLRFLTRSLLIAALVAIAAPSYAQPAQTGTIQGVVNDDTGGALPGVTVTITSQDRGFSRSTVTDGVGRYVFPSVPIGPYRIIATLQGFETAEATDNLVEVNRTTNVPINMKVGALTDTVVVLGETPIVDATTVTQTTRLTRDEFEKLPVGRTYQALIGAAPGVVGTGNVNSAGALSSNNLFVIDAVDTTDPTTGTFGTNLNFEAIQEINVMTNAVGAEYGRAQGAIVSVVTKSGTNRFEGAFKYIFANDNWNAQNTVNERNDRCLARTRQVRQGQPDLLAARRWSHLARSRLVLRHLGAVEEHDTAAADRRPDSPGLSADDGVEVLEHPWNCADCRRPYRVGQVLPVADRWFRR
jgi:hypothetical protein